MTKFSLLTGTVLLALVLATPAHARRGDDGGPGWMFERGRRDAQMERRDERAQQREDRRRQELSPEQRRDLRQDIRDFGRDFERLEPRRRFRDR
jgi:hypothetical protein